TPVRLSWLFAPYLSELYNRRQWSQIEKFESIGPGAHLITALVVGGTRPGDFVSSSEAPQVERFVAARTGWLNHYLFSSSCPAECKSRVVDMLLTGLAESSGQFVPILKALFTRPRAEVATALARLQTRLITCQVSENDLAALRDRVL